MKLNMVPHDFPGKFIVFEGVDGAGKTSMIKHAAEILKRSGVPLYLTKAPSDRVRSTAVFRNFHDSFSELERKKIGVLSLTIFVSGDRLIVQEEEIIPKLKAGYWVLCDRFVYSGLACAKDPVIVAIANLALQPDAVFLANASPATVKSRVLARDDEKNLYYDDERVMHQIATFQEMAADNDFIVVNTEESPEFSQARVAIEIEKLLVGQ